MQPSCHQFPDNVKQALRDDNLRKALARTASGFPLKRQQAIERLPEFERLRDQAVAIRNHVLDNLDTYLEHFESQVTAQGGVVHWCSTADDARATVLEICRSVEARTVTKGKSMIGEELGLNAHLEAHGITPIETDLGEYIIQLRQEPPSHIIAPAIHVTKEQVAEAFRTHHTSLDADRPLGEPEALLREARSILRSQFLAADVGITGANFLIAETGSTVIVTNEGNGDLTQMLPPVHIVLASIEKIAPTLEDATTLTRVLARSATGQEQAVYTTFSTGPRRTEDSDGPSQFHVVIIDNGRSELLASEQREILRCIRCGACLMHCPVYTAIGGHAYGWVYSGPMGAALMPGLLGLAETHHLPNASTLCGRCESVCPVRIPLPKLLRNWRIRGHRQGHSSWRQRWGLRLWGALARRPRLYHAATRMAVRLLRLWGGANGAIRWLPLAGGWTRTRHLPAPEGQTFQEIWRQQGGAS